MTLPNIGSVRAAVGSASLTMPIGRGTPVWPGRPISASVWIAASERVRVMLQGRNAAGSWTTRAEVSVQPGEMRNVGLTLHPTAETVSASLELLSTAAFTAARPSITWTETPPAWSPGRGAAQVVIHDYADTEDQASRWSQSTQRMSYSATVTEVGRGA
ncbi:hypothetical protein [Kocuria sp.]|uniref:hypothetical protein n=1 Tax=Kocuria sp. TaxID=1871328 RepID=UPI0026DEDAE1|nr:hypothetical protein [Kocuria sp.]